MFAGVFLEASIDKIKQEFPSGRVVPVPLNVKSEASVLEAARLITEQLKRENAQLVGVVNKYVIIVVYMHLKKRLTLVTVLVSSSSLAQLSGRACRSFVTCSM